MAWPCDSVTPVSTSSLASTLALPLSSALAVVASLALAAPPAAQPPDPTRPPVAIQLAVAASGVAARLNPVGSSAAPIAPADLPAPVLQAVQLPTNGAATALIDGRLLKVGETLGEHLLIAIDHQGVILRVKGRTQRLRLLGDRAKQPVGSIVLSRSPTWEASSARASTPSAPAPDQAAGQSPGPVQTTPRPSNPSLVPPAMTPPLPVTLTAQDRP